MAKAPTPNRAAGTPRLAARGHSRLNPPTIKGSLNYSHGIAVDPGARFLAISGQVGRDADGSVPKGIEAQAALAWRNVRSVLEAAGMGVEDIVSYVSYLIRREDAAGYGRVRLQALGHSRPTSTLIFISGLGESKPKLLCEVQVFAAKVPPKASRARTKRELR
jgi:2-iminobutanoate/2-iminopropanoate deaminase